MNTRFNFMFLLAFGIFIASFLAVEPAHAGSAQSALSADASARIQIEQLGPDSPLKSEAFGAFSKRKNAVSIIHLRSFRKLKQSTGTTVTSRPTLRSSAVTRLQVKTHPTVAPNRAENGVKTVPFSKRLASKAEIALIRKQKQTLPLVSFEGPFGSDLHGGMSYFVVGTVFLDANENGLRETSEPGIPNVVVKIKHDRRGEIGWVVTDETGGYNTRMLTPNELDRHEFFVPATASDLEGAYANSVLSDYFEFVPARQDVPSAGIDLGFTLRTKALLDDLNSADPDGDGFTLSVDGQTPQFWVGRIGNWSKPVFVRFNGETVEAAEALAPGPGIAARLKRQVAALELNHRSRQGLDISDPGYEALQAGLIGLGRYAVSNLDSLDPAYVMELISIFRAINGSTR
jgi:SdrD B-like domain